MKTFRYWRDLQLPWRSLGGSLRNCRTDWILLLGAGGKAFAQYPEITYRPVTGQSGRIYLFGDWDGARTDLADRGITFKFENTNDNLWVLHGYPAQNNSVQSL